MSICFCLATPALFGFSPGAGKAIKWACSSMHVEIQEQIYGKEDAMSEIEAKAREKAGQVAGEYLSDIVGQTDLAQLTPEQYDIFLQAVIATYRETVTDLCLPF